MPITSSPKDNRALVAIDLGAESCRVSLLRWIDGKPDVRMVRRFANHAVESPKGLRWNLASICAELEAGLRDCASLAPEGIISIAADGWSVDYVRLNGEGKPLDEPFCYRDERTTPIEAEVHQHLDREKLYALTGTAQIRINTLYQLLADNAAGVPVDAPWVMLPEYILYWLGGDRVAEWTNATHTGLVQLDKKNWCDSIMEELHLSRAAAPPLVLPGTIIGKLKGPLANLPAFTDTSLIAAACHDTAAAIAGMPATGDDWSYLSSGTWSLIGTVLQEPRNTPAARAAGFTNIGAVGGICFHKLINGLWLLRQSMETWAAEGITWTVPDLVKAAESVSPPDGLIDVDEADLLLPGNMPARINAQRSLAGLSPVTDPPTVARLIFQSLAAKYAQVLHDITQITGKKINRLFIVGGGSQNKLLNQLTEKAAGVKVLCGAVESSTIGNFAVQLAANEGKIDEVPRWAEQLLA